jgi:hypothetical protein
MVRLARNGQNHQPYGYVVNLSSLPIPL